MEASDTKIVEMLIKLRTNSCQIGLANAARSVTKAPYHPWSCTRMKRSPSTVVAAKNVIKGCAHSTYILCSKLVVVLKLCLSKSKQLSCRFWFCVCRLHPSTCSLALTAKSLRTCRSIWRRFARNMFCAKRKTLFFLCCQDMGGRWGWWSHLWEKRYFHRSRFGRTSSWSMVWPGATRQAKHSCPQPLGPFIDRLSCPRSWTNHQTRLGTAWTEVASQSQSDLPHGLGKGIQAQIAKCHPWLSGSPKETCQEKW